MFILCTRRQLNSIYSDRTFEDITLVMLDFKQLPVKAIRRADFVAFVDAGRAKVLKSRTGAHTSTTLIDVLAMIADQLEARRQ